MNGLRIVFQPGNIACEAKSGESLLAAAARAGVVIDGICGGAGTCGRCKVWIMDGFTPPPDSMEIAALSDRELREGCRLACRVRIVGDLSVRVAVPRDLRGMKAAAAALPEDFVPGVPPVEAGDRVYGLAFDIGTTTVAGTLWHIGERARLDGAARTNPQNVFGADVISRINSVLRDPASLPLLRDLIRSCLNEILEDLAQNAGIDPLEIRAVTLVGNTTMSHLFMGVDPGPLARAPYIPAFCSAVETDAKTVGLKAHPGALTRLLPNVASHVGSDITAAVLATRLWELPGHGLLIDVGTNGEIVLSGNGRMMACSTAAGPAFEGAAIRHGMRAASGAIEGVRIDHEQVRLEVIDGGRPVGICGSGLIDAVAALLDVGIIDASGRMADRGTAAGRGVPAALAARLRDGDNDREFVLWRDDDAGDGDIALTQKDVREVQLAKGAVHAGAALLMKEIGMDPSNLGTILLAGAFGNYIRKESALRIGLLPDIAQDRIRSVGNAAGTGAAMALLSEEAFREAEWIASVIRHVELAGRPDFQDEFLRSMAFPESVPPSKGPLVQRVQEI